MKQRMQAPTTAVMVLMTMALVPVAASPAAAQVQISARAVELEFSGRLQFEVQTTSCTEASPPASSACSTEAPGVDMFLRRARVSLEATIDDRLSFKLEPDFADIEEVAMKDAWGRYAFGSYVAVQAGHFKRPFDGFYLTSSAHLPFERAVEVPGVDDDRLASYSGLTKAFDLSDRDIGLMLEGTPGGGAFAWWLGVFTGGSASRASDSNAEKQFVGRARVALEASGAPLALAGAVAVTDAPYTSSGGETEGEYFSNFELFAELGAWDRDGLLVQAGLVAGDNPRIDDLGLPADVGARDFGSLFTWQGVAAYRVPLTAAALEAVTPFVRISYGDPTDAEADEVWGFTPGFALYFHGRNRLALTWDVASFATDGVESESSLTAQMQFHF